MDLRHTGLIAAILLCAAAPAWAEDTVARCVGAQGEPMFASRCPGQAAPPRVAQTAQAGAVPRQVSARPRPVRAQALCPRSPQELAWQVQSAIHGRNGVRLSGLALWRGMSTRGARGEVRELLQLLKAGFADVQLIAPRPAAFAQDADAGAYGAAIENMDNQETDMPQARDSSLPRRSGDYALVITSLSERRGETHSGERWFGVTRASGCYWLSLRPPAAPLPPPQTVDVPAAGEPLAWRGQ